MKSQQLLHLQQQFLKSLHSHPAPWLLAQIEPARGFGGDAEKVLSLYLERAMVRTVDPLARMFPACRWLLGEPGLHDLLQGFYASSPGEPIASEPLAYAFIGFLAGLPPADLEAGLIRGLATGVDARQAVLEAAILDGRRLWAQLAPRRPSPGPEALLHCFRERRHRWARPRLDRGTRLALTGFDLHRLERAVVDQEPLEEVPWLAAGPSWFLIHCPPGASLQVEPIRPQEARLLNGCDGTMTVTALCHQESFFAAEDAATEAELQRWITAGVIVDLQTELSPGTA